MKTAEDRGWNLDAVLRDYRIAVSKQAVQPSGPPRSICRKSEVRNFRRRQGNRATGHWRMPFERATSVSGYYRDQTLMFALDLLTAEQFFAQLYANPEIAAEPAFGGRSMTGHFATRLLDTDGKFLPQTDRYNSSADLSPTASQMPRLVGLAYASKLYRQSPELRAGASRFTSNGDEIVFGTIGNASCAEGLFWESVNAVGVLQAPMLLSIWDDGFGISVPNAFQMTKGDIARILEGFGHRPGGRPGIDLYVVRGWDYPELCSTYLEAADLVRLNHTPAILHVTELTQPFGHSTSGNHERYKSHERLEWEKEFDCLKKMREWILERKLATASELDDLEGSEISMCSRHGKGHGRPSAEPIEEERRTVIRMIESMALQSRQQGKIQELADSLRAADAPLRRHVMAVVTEALLLAKDDPRIQYRGVAGNGRGHRTR